MIHFNLVKHLVIARYLTRGMRVMDVGTQNLLYAEDVKAAEVVRALRSEPLSESASDELRRVCRYSKIPPPARTSYLHELFALTDVTYESVDVASGDNATVHDLNRAETPSRWIGQFDLVINCGTSEHILNQLRVLEFMHDVLKVGGVRFDQIPTVGYLNHGYFTYHPQFYRDIAEANDYEILEAWYNFAGSAQQMLDSYPVVSIEHLGDNKCEVVSNQIDWYNLNVFMRKTRDAPLRLPLEARTSHTPIDEAIQEAYQK